MSQKDRKKVMDDFKELNAKELNAAVDGARDLKQPAEQQQPGNQQVKLSLHEAVLMFGSQIDEIKNHLIGIILKQDNEIKRLKAELNKKTKV